MKKTLSLFLIATMYIVLSHHMQAQTQFVNPGFEEWEEIGLGPNIIEPVNWSSIKSTEDDNLNSVAPIVWGRSDDAHTGNYSLYLASVSIFGFVAPGTITNGRVHADMNPDSGYTYTDPDHDAWHTRIIAKPDSLIGWYKANPMPGDYAKIRAVVHSGYIAVSESKDTTGFIGSGTLALSGEPVNEWRRFSIPIHYYLDEEPEFILLTISSSLGVDALAGSEVWLDDLELIYNNGTGIAEEDPDNLQLYTSGNRLHVFVKGDRTEDYYLHIYDTNGKLRMESKGVINQKNTFSYSLPKGIYVVSLSYGEKVLTKKIRL